MDAVRLNSLIYRGRQKAADHLGMPCNVFRPNNPTAPFTNQIGQFKISLNAADQKYLKPNLYGKPVWFADYDGRLTQPGDYLMRVSDGATWFVAAQQSLLPIVAIACNARVGVRRQPTNSTFGVTDQYGGIVNPSYVLGTMDSLWPASILIGGRALAAMGLPADVKESGWKILLPASVPLAIQASDRIDDEQSRGFWVESSESTDMGWRLTCNEAHA